MAIEQILENAACTTVSMMQTPAPGFSNKRILTPDSHVVLVGDYDHIKGLSPQWTAQHEGACTLHAKEVGINTSLSSLSHAT